MYIKLVRLTCYNMYKIILRLNMRIAVVGLGGVGGYICASFNKTKHNVVGFARGEHLKKIQDNGLEIVEDSLSWNEKIDARELDNCSGYFDLVLFCVKSYDLVESYERISKCIDSKSTILSLSNGVNNGDILRRLTKSTVLEGCVYILSHIKEPGIIRKKGKLFACVFGGDSVSTEKLSKIFDEAKLRYKTPSDIKQAIWRKFIFISAFATSTSYYDKSIGFVYENHRDEVKKVLEEIANVANSMEIDIYDEIEKSLQTASKVPYDSSTSMHLDFQNKKRVELESLTGYVVEHGKKYGVETPQILEMYEGLVLKNKAL